MATEAVNGSGYDQYTQPAELAASTPANGAAATSNSSATASSNPKPDPQEIGWYFVEQYYTTLSKTPDKIHLFYNKKSQLITGTEAEKVLPSVGSKAISEKIKSLEISDCKIRVLNVDCQASYDNIVVQVIGEMSNKNQPHHKFVQTFILATQPNGYFVLNDIFRYLSDSEDEIVDDEPAAATTADATAASTAAGTTASSAKAVEAEESRETTEPTATPAAADEVVNTEAAVQQVDHELQDAAKDETSSTDEVNGDDANSEEQTPEVTEETKPEAVSTEPAAPAQSEATSESVSNSGATAPAAPSGAAPAKKTWANMVGTKAPAVPALPQAQAQTQTQAAAPVTTTAAPGQSKATPQGQAQSQAQAPRATSAAPTAKSSDSPAETSDAAGAQSNGWQEAGKKPKQQAKASEGIVHAYIKNVNEKIDARVLREVLEKYGKLKYFDVSRPKQCAFVEYEDAAAYAAAVAENPHTVGSETINVEERRPRPGNGANYSGNNFGRGAASAGRGRGGTQQRAGSQGGSFARDAATGAAGSRGNFQGQRGNKSATPTRGRGQAAAQ